MLYRHVIRCMPQEDIFRPLLAATAPVLSAFRQRTEQGEFALLALPDKRDDIPLMQQVAAQIRDHYSDLVILGTGGSALNGQALTSLAQAASPRLHFVDNVDPHTISQLFATLDLPHTAFLAISKSGKTVETLSQMLIAIDALGQRVGSGALGRQFYVITDPQDNPIRRLGAAIGATLLEHEPHIGGRFAAFTNVALLPALVSGLDAAAFRAGAEAVVRAHLYPHTHPEAAKGAALAIALAKQGCAISVMMPYVDRLSHFASWYRQMWAESLGKNGQGTTPVKAMGTIDQHSQLQLYLDGPRNKMVTFITLDTKGKGPVVPAISSDSAFAYITGKTLGDIIAAEQQATEDTLVESGCPVRSFQLPRLDEETMGALLMHFMLETIIAAELLGINAYDQPAVEAGKIRTRELLVRA